jgi:hypothetical protein
MGSIGKLGKDKDLLIPVCFGEQFVQGIQLPVVVRIPVFA